MDATVKGAVNQRRNKLASLEAMLVQNYDLMTDLLMGVKCRAKKTAKRQISCIFKPLFCNKCFATSKKQQFGVEQENRFASLEETLAQNYNPATESSGYILKEKVQKTCIAK